MRTYVRMMGVGPYRPTRELEAALERRELDIAIGIAKDIARERRPIGLPLALRLVALVAEQGNDYDLVACRWLARWLSETPETTISLAAEGRRHARRPARRAGRRRGDPPRSCAEPRPWRTPPSRDARRRRFSPTSRRSYAA